MSLRFTSQLMIDNLPDEQFSDQFEVIMPALSLDGDEDRSWFSSLTGMIYRPIVEEITFGFMNFTTDTRRVRTGYYNVPKDIEAYHDVKISMFCSSNMLTQYYLEAWRDLIFNKRGEYYNPGIKYKKNIEVFMYGPGGNNAVTSLFMPKFHYTLKGCFPSSEDDFKLEYTDSPKRFRISCTFKVDCVIKDKSSAAAAARAELLTSPTAIFDNALSSLTSSNSKYSLADTYGGGDTGSLMDKAKSTIKNLF